MVNIPPEDWSDDEDIVKEKFSEVEEIGDRRNEIVFIGTFEDKDREDIKKVLDDCLVTDAEMEKIMEHGVDMDDPFDSWYKGNVKKIEGPRIGIIYCSRNCSRSILVLLIPVL